MSRPIATVLAALALCLGFGLISAGCGARTGPVPVPDATPDNPVPESTLSRLKECAEQWADDLESRSYEVGFELTITEVGYVDEAEPMEPRLGVRAMESCMASALRTMYVPQFVMEKVSSELSSQGMSAEERGLIGQTETMDKFILTLGPIIIEAGPVAIILTLAIVGTVAMVKLADKKEQEECNKEWKDARDDCIELLNLRDPPRYVKGPYNDVENCARGLVREKCGGNRIDYGDQGARPGRKT